MSPPSTSTKSLPQASGVAGCRAQALAGTLRRLDPELGWGLQVAAEPAGGGRENLLERWKAGPTGWSTGQVGGGPTSSQGVGAAGGGSAGRVRRTGPSHTPSATGGCSHRRPSPWHPAAEALKAELVVQDRVPAGSQAQTPCRVDLCTKGFDPSTGECFHPDRAQLRGSGRSPHLQSFPVASNNR